MASKAVALIEETLKAAEAPEGGNELAVLLKDNAREGLTQLRAIIGQPLDLGDLKQQRLVGDMSLGVLRLLMRAAEGDFQRQRADRFGELLERIAEAKKE